jgi:hypothetical protein
VQPGSQAIGVQSFDAAGSLNADSSSEEAATPTDPLQESSVSSGSTDDSWKTEYESQVETWRAQSSEAREKAEKERERWETIRAAEQAEAARHKAMGIVDEPTTEPHEQQEAGWETVSNKKSHPLSESTTISDPHSPSPVGARELVTGESESQVCKSLDSLPHL